MTEKYDFRLGEERLNNQGCLMRIIEYISARNIVVEFQDEYKTKIRTTYNTFKSGGIKNPYCFIVYGVGAIGNKYPTKVNGKLLKEYESWTKMLQRCYSNKYKEKRPTYQNVTCCEEWLLYESFMSGYTHKIISSNG